MEPFPTKRSPVVCRNGCVSCSQPLAAEAGLRILRSGGNAADAAVAVAGAMNVTQPCSTGIGGDCFCLFYDSSTRKVSGINGSGRAPQGLSLEYLNTLGYNSSNPVPPRHALTVTVPGAAAAWADTISTFGSGKVCCNMEDRWATLCGWLVCSASDSSGTVYYSQLLCSGTSKQRTVWGQYKLNNLSLTKRLSLLDVFLMKKFGDLSV